MNNSYSFPSMNKGGNNPSFCLITYAYQQINLIGGVMASVLASRAVDHRFDPRSGQTKDFKIDICCFSGKHATLRRKGKDWLAWNQDVRVERHFCRRTIVKVNYQYKNPTKRIGLVQSGHHHHLIEN